MKISAKYGLTRCRSSYYRILRFGHRSVANEMKTQQSNLLVNQHEKSVVNRRDQIGWIFDLIKQTEIERAQLSRYTNRHQ